VEGPFSNKRYWIALGIFVALAIVGAASKGVHVENWWPSLSSWVWIAVVAALLIYHFLWLRRKKHADEDLVEDQRKIRNVENEVYVSQIHDDVERGVRRFLFWRFFNPFN
jgi:cyanate permease